VQAVKKKSRNYFDFLMHFNYLPFAFDENSGFAGQDKQIFEA
jgi:hypothetical protein